MFRTDVRNGSPALIKEVSKSLPALTDAGPAISFKPQGGAAKPQVGPAVSFKPQ